MRTGKTAGSAVKQGGTAKTDEKRKRKDCDIQMVLLDILKKVNATVMSIIKLVLIVFGTAMTVLVIMNVLLRYVFNSGLTWSEEASRFLFIWTTFLGAILANDGGFHGQHMRMDFIVDKFHGKLRKGIEVGALLVVAFLLCQLFMGGVQVVVSTWAFKTSALRIPKGLVYLCAPIGFGYMALQTVAKIALIFRATDEELNRKEAE